MSSMLTKSAIEHYGSVSALAAALGITTAAVYQWGEVVPLLRAYQLERLTSGELAVNEEPEPAA